MSAADEAYKAAQEEIARVKAAGETSLDFGEEAFRMLEALPPEISDLTELEELFLNTTQVTDLTPLHDLTGLQWLHLNMTYVSDLSPIRKLPRCRGST